MKKGSLEVELSVFFSLSATRGEGKLNNKELNWRKWKETVTSFFAAKYLVRIPLHTEMIGEKNLEAQRSVRQQLMANVGEPGG